ncbi:ABC transporter, ATP-binding protein [Bacillus sp. JCM 19046]|nr:ABC transporter, ATP-binding protein [Bacillus sp. JCM 19045]GAF17058.1 ABC transporter, ATP-binding protein [Bacillus sp. JCM 19046]
MDVKIDHLTKSNRVKDVSFQLHFGKITALIGANGAGKTTLLHMLAGILSPSKGTIQFDVKKEDIRSLIGFMPQYPAFHQWMSAKEYLVYAGRLSGLSTKQAERDAEDGLIRVGLDPVNKQRIEAFSGGMKQRLGIAQALIGNPPILLLDEPVSALDPKGRSDVMDLLNELKGKQTILYSTHVLHDAEKLCDDVIMLHHGRMIKRSSLNDLLQLAETGKFIVETSAATDLAKKLKIVEPHGKFNKGMAALSYMHQIIKI